MFGKERSLREILYTVIQRFCKSLDKGAAAGGTRLVELYGIYRLVFDLDTFHVLTADINNTVYIGVEEGSGIVVCHSLNLALVKHKRRFEQCLAVSCRAGVNDGGIIGQQAVDFLNGGDGSVYGTAVVAAIK